MIGYLFLAGAIVSEVIATSFLKYAGEPKSAWWTYCIVAVGYVLSFGLLSFTLRAGVPLSIAYAVWSGVGVVAVAVISRLVFEEALTWPQVLGMALVVVGVGLLELGGGQDRTPSSNGL